MSAHFQETVLTDSQNPRIFDQINAFILFQLIRSESEFHTQETQFSMTCFLEDLEIYILKNPYDINIAVFQSY